LLEQQLDACHLQKITVPILILGMAAIIFTRQRNPLRGLGQRGQGVRHRRGRFSRHSPLQDLRDDARAVF
jgi:hypothetical protein